MKNRKYGRNVVIGLLFSLVICLYFVIDQDIDIMVKQYIQKTLRYNIAVWVNCFYGFVAAVLIRIGYEVVVANKRKLKANITAITMLCGLCVASVIFWKVEDLRPILFNTTFIISAWTTLLFCLS